MEVFTNNQPAVQLFKEFDKGCSPVTCKSTDYPADWENEPHFHRRHQLLYAVRGVMVVKAEMGRWVVPPTRAIWVTAGVIHQIRCVGELHMRSADDSARCCTGIAKQDTSCWCLALVTRTDTGCNDNTQE